MRQSSVPRNSCSACGDRNSRWCPHVAATPENERRLHQPKSTAMAARRCAPPKSSPSRAYSGELGTSHGKQVLLSVD